LLYDEGEYFAEIYRQDGKIHLFAHFTMKSPRRSQQAPVGARQHLHEPS
jgi:hypothetical protein